MGISLNERLYVHGEAIGEAFLSVSGAFRLPTCLHPISPAVP